MSPYIYMRDVLVHDLIVLANTIWEVGMIESDATPEGSIIHLHLWTPGLEGPSRSPDCRHSTPDSGKLRLLRSAPVSSGGFRPV